MFWLIIYTYLKSGSANDGTMTGRASFKRVAGWANARLVWKSQKCYKTCTRNDSFPDGSEIANGERGSLPDKYTYLRTSQSSQDHIRDVPLPYSRTIFILPHLQSKVRFPVSMHLFKITNVEVQSGNAVGRLLKYSMGKTLICYSYNGCYETT